MLVNPTALLSRFGYRVPGRMPHLLPRFPGKVHTTARIRTLGSPGQVSMLVDGWSRAWDRSLASRYGRAITSFHRPCELGVFRLCHMDQGAPWLNTWENDILLKERRDTLYFVLRRQMGGLVARGCRLSVGSKPLRACYEVPDIFISSINAHILLTDNMVNTDPSKGHAPIEHEFTIDQFKYENEVHYQRMRKSTLHAAKMSS